MPIALIILAAGKGTRMHSDMPKVLHQVASAPLLAHAMQAGSALEVDRTIVVAGFEADQVRAATAVIDPEAQVVVQAEQLGTGHAVAQARDALADFTGDAIVLYGDTPFVSPKTLEKMRAARLNGADIVVLGFKTETPGGYGRLILSKEENLDAIIEAKDATEAQRYIKLCNSGVICADAGLLMDLVAQLGNDNASGEYYLTDIIALANQAGKICRVVICPMAETFGINSRVELAAAEKTFQTAARLSAMENGATLTDPDSVFFALDTYIGKDVEIGPNVVFGPGVTVESGAIIRPFCHLEGCHISQHAIIGPFARLRPGAEIGDHARVGNFVEIKASEVGEGAKINHLSYVGNATIGTAANIGAGTITCNYDGVMKHQTEIGAHAFIGSNSSLVAPVRIGVGAMVGSGSVISSDIEDGALGITRVAQKVHKGFAIRFFKKLRAIKAAKSK